MSVDSDLVVFRRAPKGVSRPGVRAFAARLQDEVAGGRLFCCLIAGDRELRELNRDFLGKDWATDVLSFPADAPDEARLGDLAISAARAAAQARAYGHSTQQEISILMLHGVLHLLGMDHEFDRGRMARAERKWRTALGLPVGLIERHGG